MIRDPGKTELANHPIHPSHPSHPLHPYHPSQKRADRRNRPRVGGYLEGIWRLSALRLALCADMRVVPEL